MDTGGHNPLNGIPNRNCNVGSLCWFLINNNQVSDLVHSENQERNGSSSRIEHLLFFVPSSNWIANQNLPRELNDLCYSLRSKCSDIFSFE